MLPSLLRLPVGVTLCGASLCAAAVLLFQNVPTCVRWIEEHELASFNQFQASVRLLQRMSESVCLPALNQAELSLADSVSSRLELPIGESKPPSIPQLLPDAPPPATPLTEAEVCDTACVDCPSTPQVPPTEPPEARVSNREAGCAQPEGGTADEEVKAEPKSSREGSRDRERAKYPGIFAPSPFLSVPPRFSFSFPRNMLSADAFRQSIIGARAAAPQSTSAKPPERIVSQPEVGNNTEQPTGSTPTPVAKPDAPSAAPATLAEGETTPSMRCRILMVGDSLMETLGPMTHRAMSHRMGLEFIISARFSTGLCRPDYFSWPEHLSDVARRHKPDLAIFFIGANDGMPVLVGKHYVPVGSANWRAAYADKMAELVDIVHQAGADIIWVELPSASPKFNKHLSDTRQVQHSFCESHGISIFHTDLIFSGEEGRFEPYGDFHDKLTRLRKKDLVHITTQGNQKLIEHLLPLIEQHLYAFYTAHPERHLNQEELANIHRVPVMFTCSAYSLRPQKRKKRAPVPLPH